LMLVGVATNLPKTSERRNFKKFGLGGASLAQEVVNVAWTVRSTPEEIDRGLEARSWKWRIERNEDVRTVWVHVTNTALNSTQIPDTTRKAIETQGRSEIDAILDQDDPPAEITCTTAGCSPA
jgi:hypothetical protein